MFDEVPINSGDDSPAARPSRIEKSSSLADLVAPLWPSRLDCDDGQQFRILSPSPYTSAATLHRIELGCREAALQVDQVLKTKAQLLPLLYVHDAVIFDGNDPLPLHAQSKVGAMKTIPLITSFGLRRTFHFPEASLQSKNHLLYQELNLRLEDCSLESVLFMPGPQVVLLCVKIPQTPRERTSFEYSVKALPSTLERNPLTEYRTDKNLDFEATPSAGVSDPFELAVKANFPVKKKRGRPPKSKQAVYSTPPPIPPPSAPTNGSTPTYSAKNFSVESCHRPARIPRDTLEAWKILHNSELLVSSNDSLANRPFLVLEILNERDGVRLCFARENCMISDKDRLISPAVVAFWERLEDKGYQPVLVFSPDRSQGFLGILRPSLNDHRDEGVT